MHRSVPFVLASLALGSVGCVPLSDYRKLEHRFQEQEAYVSKHKDKMREHERREQVLTLRAREQERQLELARARLAKSETLRQRMETRTKTVAASSPKPVVEPAPAPVERTTPASIDGLEVNPATRGLVLDGGVLFASGKATLSPGGEQVLRRVVKLLNEPRYKGHAVQVEGHTDDAPIKRSGHQSNWELSAKRAVAVLHFLEKQGVSPQRLAAVGHGAVKPLVKGDTAKAKAKNRRVEIVLHE